MVTVDSTTLMMAIQAVDEVIGRLVEATAEEDSADPNDQIALMDYRRAAKRLEDAYGKLCETELDLPPYDELVNHG
ncbi:MAG: hypothetical protein ACK5QH_04945 [Rubrivivax sp.]|jgi:hypothetical protein